ncbi:hypothetical protein CYY_004278 [Polysphondylium violaceum]|uniref:VPS37 C-terminal domain-containing protein n=1 Tax=Polysphondylium violaceum TaxID=133409 RepID=A0A8J4PVF9_9MYCE|nr:hypothetical protein CYY_004278 [Polysphondylium violaceum]
MSNLNLQLISKLKQINLLKERFSNTIEVERDSTFKIPLGVKPVHLLISLPVNFPTSPPSFFLEIYETHHPVSLPKLDISLSQPSYLATVTFQIIGHYLNTPNSLDTLIQNSKALYQQQQQQQQQQQSQQPPNYSPPPPYKELQQQQQPQQPNKPISKDPPAYKDVTSIYKDSTVLPAPTSSNSSNNSNNNSNSSNNNSSKQQSKTTIPSLPTEFPELKSKSKEELEELLESEDSLNAFIYTYDSVSQMSDQRSKLESENKKLTESVDQLTEEIGQLKKQQDKKIEVEELKKEYERLLAKKNVISNQYSLPNLLEKLNDSINIYEAESDSIAATFLEGNLELKEFKKLYREKRALYHSKSANKEMYM